MPDVVRVLLADDHPLVLDGVRHLLERDPALEAVGQAERAEAAIAEAAALQPDLLILDHVMPGPPAAQVAREVAARSPQTRILVLTDYPDAACLREMRRAGAAGCLSKNEPLETVLQAIHTVAAGGTWFPKRAQDGYAPAGVACPEGRRRAYPALTEGELVVLRLLVDGLTDEEIAARVHVTDRAVRHTLRRLYDKLGVDRRVQAAVQALRLGLME